MLQKVQGHFFASFWEAALGYSQKETTESSYGCFSKLRPEILAVKKKSNPASRLQLLITSANFRNWKRC